LPQHDPQQPIPNPTVIRAAKAGFGLLLGALALTPCLAALPTARADTAGQTVEQISPLDEERAAKKAAAEAASGTPDPAPVPEPPEQSSDDEAPIELPIVPAGSRQDEPDEALATVTGPSDGPSDGIALVTDDADQLQSLRVLFPKDGTSIDAAAESELIGLAGYLNNHQAQRLVLHAHAGDSAQGSSHARRLSLSRALAIRTFLVDRGVPVDRIYLRPLGSEVEDGPPDRVDILPLRP
jgi:outer membrane protein OmpA-like peptidoglycan-associated protein